MTWKPALIRALRTFLQGVVGVTGGFVLWLGSQSALDWGEIKVQGSKLVLALLVAFGTAIVSFIQNVLEDSTQVGSRIPKG